MTTGHDTNEAADARGRGVAPSPMTAMREEILALESRLERLQEVLVGHLLRVVDHWPGAESMTIEDVLPCYLQAARSGRAPDERELLRTYPELVTEIEIFFAVRAADR
jgi:hypothetical protein